MDQQPDTYFTLYEAMLNLNQTRRNNWAAFLIHAPLQKSFKQFEKMNNMAIRHLRDKEKELLAAHVEWSEEKGYAWEPANRVSQLRVAGEAAHAPMTAYRGLDNMVPVFKSAEDARDFNEAWNKLMHTVIKIVW